MDHEAGQTIGRYVRGNTPAEPYYDFPSLLIVCHWNLGGGGQKMYPLLAGRSWGAVEGSREPMENSKSVPGDTSFGENNHDATRVAGSV